MTRFVCQIYKPHETLPTFVYAVFLFPGVISTLLHTEYLYVVV